MIFYHQVALKMHSNTRVLAYTLDNGSMRCSTSRIHAVVRFSVHFCLAWQQNLNPCKTLFKAYIKLQNTIFKTV